MSVLLRPTLILNKSWYPIDSATVKDSLCRVISERAVFLDTLSYTQHDISSWMRLPVKNEEPFIRTLYGKIRVPEILLLSEYNKVPVRKVVFCRRNLWKRDRCRCQYCGKEPGANEITIDHVLPKSKGGQSIFENCVLCCVKCNLKKGNKTLQQAGMQLRRLKKLFNGDWRTVYYNTPKHPVWNPLYALKRKIFPRSWKMFLKNFEETLYWEVGLET